MQPFDDLSEVEKDPQNEDILQFLRQVHSLPVDVRPEPEPEQQAIALAGVRQRLLLAQQQKPEQEGAYGQEPALSLLPASEMSTKVSRRSKQKQQTTRGNGWRHRFALIAAAILLILLIGSLLSVLHLAKQSHQVSKRQTQLGAAQQSSQAIYVYSGLWLQKIDALSGKVLWQVKVPGANPIYQPAPVAVNNGIVYVAASKNLSALRATDGTLLWKINLDAQVWDLQPLIQGNLLYLVDHAQPANLHANAGDFYLEAFNITSGSQVWRYHVKGQIFDVVLNNGVLYGSASLLDTSTSRILSNFLFAVSVNGVEQWQVPTRAAAGVGHMIAVANGRIYSDETVALPQNKFQVYSYAYSTSNGAFLWRSPALPNLDGAEQPIVVQNTLYIMSMGGLYALDAQDGHILWQHPDMVYADIGNSVSIGSKTLVALIIGSDGNILVELNTSSGAIVARHPVENFENLQMQAGVGSYSFSELSTALVSTPTSFVTTPDGHLDALDTTTGKRLWSTKLAGSPAIASIVLAA